MLPWLRGLWQQHGTKLIGFGGTALGALSMVDATTVHIIEGTLGEHWGHRVASGLMIIGGVATAYRGYTNSKK